MPRSNAMVATAILPLLLSPFAAAAAELAVTIDGGRSADGQFRVALFESASGFPGGPEAPAKAETIAAKDGSVIIDFADMKAGIYAVAVYHDENGNGELDKNMLGIPTEGYGFSNNARGFMGPPTFADAAVTLKGQDQAITISLVYWIDTKEWDSGTR